MKKIKTLVIYYLLGFLVGFIFFSIIFKYFIFCSRMTGESMLPTLKPNDMIFFIKTNNIHVGNIIIYKHSTGIDVIHRVIDIKDESYITKGDNNEWYDWTENITQGKIKGKMIFRIPFGDL